MSSFVMGGPDNEIGGGERCLKFSKLEYFHSFIFRILTPDLFGLLCTNLPQVELELTTFQNVSVGFARLTRSRGDAGCKKINIFRFLTIQFYPKVFQPGTAR